MSQGPRSVRTQVKRLPARGHYERGTIDAILDEALHCHVGFSVDGQPFVIPTIHVRVGDRLILHGSTASRMLRRLGEGVPACVTVTLLDGLVLARSAFHHSMNYRSVMALGMMTAVDSAEKEDALRKLVDHVAPGRSDHVRGPSARELAQTTVLQMNLAEASAKVRTGPPVDDEGDLSLDVWAGELPIRLVTFPPLPDPLLGTDIPVPEHVSGYRRPRP